MLVLALDTATPDIAVAVLDVGPTALRTLARHEVVAARGHAEGLAPAVAGTLAEAGATVRDLGAVVVGQGPGPFTGLRVGLVTAAMLGDTLAVPVHGVCSLDGLRPTDYSPGPYAAVTDARRREVYWAVYDRDGRRLRGPEVGRPADVAPLLVAAGARVACGGGAAAYAEVLQLPVSPPAGPDPALLAARARDRLLAGAPSEVPQPLYLRRPDVREPGPRKRVLGPR